LFELWHYNWWLMYQYLYHQLNKIFIHPIHLIHHLHPHLIPRYFIQSHQFFYYSNQTYLYNLFYIYNQKNLYSYSFNAVFKSLYSHNKNRLNVDALYGSDQLIPFILLCLFNQFNLLILSLWSIYVLPVLLPKCII
jgi:hypothetical protein